MVGGVLFGHLADVFGRKPVMMATLLLLVGVGVGISFVPSYWLFATLRFFQGMLMQVKRLFDSCFPSMLE